MSTSRKAHLSTLGIPLFFGVTCLLGGCGGASSEGAAKEPGAAGATSTPVAPAVTGSAAASVAPASSAAASGAPVASAAASAPGAPVGKLTAGMEKPITLEGTTPAKREVTTPCGHFTKAPSAVLEVPEEGLKSAGVFLAFEKGGEGRRFLFAREGWDPATATLKDPKTHQCLPTSYVGKLPAGRHAIWVGSETQDVALPFRFLLDTPSDPKSEGALLLLASNVGSDLPVEKRALSLHYPRLTELVLESEVTTIQGAGQTKRALELRRRLWLAVPEGLLVFAKPDSVKAFSSWKRPLTAEEPLLVTKVLPYLVRAMTADGKDVDFKSVDLLTTTRPASVRVDTQRNIPFGPDDPQNKDYTSPQMAPLVEKLAEAEKKYQVCFEPKFKPEAVPDSALSTREIMDFGHDGARQRVAERKADAACKTELSAYESARAPLRKAQIEARKARHAEVIAEIAARFAK